MGATNFEQAMKMAAMADKISKIAKMGSMASKGVLINSDIVKWADEGAKIHSLLNKKIFTPFESSYRLMNLINSAPVAVADAIQIKPFHFPPPSEEEISKMFITTSPSVIVGTNTGGMSRNYWAHLDTIREITLKELEAKQKAEEDLIDWFNQEDDSEEWDFVSEPSEGYKISRSISRRNVDALNRAVQIALNRYAFNEKRKVIDYEAIKKLFALLELQEEIRERQKIVSIVRDALKQACSQFRLFQINLREHYRKIQSFLFKNLDDYHSTPAVSLGY